MSTQYSKLAFVDSKLGAPSGGQDTTRYVYDSVNSAAGQQFYEFFTNFAGKTEFQTNLTTNKLDSAESMVIKSIYICSSSGTALQSHSLLNITVGNQVVLKDFDISFNSGQRGLEFDRLHGTVAFGFDNLVCEIRLLTDIVIPPQVNFKATLQLAFAAIAVNDDITIGLKGYGKLFSAGNTF